MSPQRGLDVLVSEPAPHIMPSGRGKPKCGLHVECKFPAGLLTVAKGVNNWSPIEAVCRETCKSSHQLSRSVNFRPLDFRSLAFDLRRQACPVPVVVELFRPTSIVE